MATQGCPRSTGATLPQALRALLHFTFPHMGAAEVEQILQLRGVHIAAVGADLLPPEVVEDILGKDEAENVQDGYWT
eukprot:8917211-Lingulodinium_polyedra.AAC.1